MTVGFETTGLQDHRNLDSLNILYLGTKKVLDKGMLDHKPLGQKDLAAMTWG